MSPPAHSEQFLTWGEQTISYELSFEPRKDLAITVHPDLRVTVRAPDTKPTAKINQRVQAKRAWIARQLRDFEQYLPLPTPRRFVSGETHWYLGRQYRLRLIAGPPSVRCSAGRLIVSVPNPAATSSVKRTLDAWYDRRAHAVFGERLVEVQGTLRRLARVTPRLKVQRMLRRWGSCTPRGTVTLNTELVRAPKACVDYVILHELCHLLVPTHSPAFFCLLASYMPDWESRRKRLNRIRP